MRARGQVDRTGASVKLSAPVQARLRELSAELTAVKGRQVSLSEVIEGLLQLAEEAPRGLGSLIPGQSIFRSLDEARDT